MEPPLYVYGDKEASIFGFYFAAMMSIFDGPLVFDLKRSIRKIKSYRLEIVESSLLINTRLICPIEEMEYIFIQPVRGSSGLGVSYTVGLKYARGHKSLIYDVDKESAKSEAGKPADFLELIVSELPSKILALYRGY